MSPIEALAWVKHWLDLYGCTAPEAVESRNREIASDFVRHIRLARTNAFKEAAAMCESEIATDDPGPMPNAQLMRSVATASLELMARKFRRAVEGK